jgi:hypothetical protein
MPGGGSPDLGSRISDGERESLGDSRPALGFRINIASLSRRHQRGFGNLGGLRHLSTHFL